MVKVWNLDKTDKNKSPLCLRTSKVLYENKAYSVSCVAVMENLSQMAVGLANGAVILMRGDISRDRIIKQKILFKGDNPITGLAFRDQGTRTFLFVVTPVSVDVYNTTNGKDSKVPPLYCHEANEPLTSTHRRSSTIRAPSWTALR